MKRYIGLKIVQAEPQQNPNEAIGDDGHKVVYEDGYKSWSPSAAFEGAYREIDAGVPFSIALESVKRGGRWYRKGWNGVAMFIFLVPGSTFKVNRPPLLGIYPEGTEIDYRAHIDMKTADGSIVTWVASQTDLIADDWFELGART